MPFFGTKIYKVKTRTVNTRQNETADQEPAWGKKNWRREHLIEKNQFHSTWQIISSQTVNQEMRTTCLMPHFPILALHLTLRPVRISHLLMKPNRHVSYSQATEDELRTSSCFRTKGRLYNAGHFLPKIQTSMRKLRLSCGKTIEILNTKRMAGLQLTYRIEKSLFQIAKGKSAHCRRNRQRS